jgi:hypothetical protein
MRTLVVTAAAIALLSGASGLAQWRDAHVVLASPSDNELYLTSGATARRLAAGYTTLAADLYWIRAVQYFGRERLKALHHSQGMPAEPSDNYARLYPLLDLTTSLDPRFNIAYRFGSLFLAEAPPGGPGRPDLAIALLEKGLAAQPDKWEYMQDIGFVHYWWREDYKAAATWFDRAGQVPGAPWFLRSLAASTVAAGGDRESSRMIWQSLYDGAELDWLRRDAEKHLLQLEALDAIDELQPIIDRAAAQIPDLQASWESLIRHRVLRGVPADATGTPFDIDATGRVIVSPRSPLYPVRPQPVRPPS